MTNIRNARRPLPLAGSLSKSRRLRATDAFLRPPVGTPQGEPFSLRHPKPPFIARTVGGEACRGCLQRARHLQHVFQNAEIRLTPHIGVVFLAFAQLRN